MNLAQQSFRSESIARTVNELHICQAVGKVCRWIEDAGGVFSGLNARTAQAKVRSVLNEPENRAVVGYHSTSATRDWPDDGSADDELQNIARRVARRIGPLLPNTAALFAARLLCELAGTCPEALTPEVAEHVRKRCF